MPEVTFQDLAFLEKNNRTEINLLLDQNIELHNKVQKLELEIDMIKQGLNLLLAEKGYKVT